MPTHPSAIVFVTNDGAAGADMQPLDQALQTLRTAGVPAEVLTAQQGAQMPQLAAQAAQQAARSGGAVVAAGGDGTINAVAAAALDAGCPMGVLPQGTFNYFAREHLLPSDPDEAVQVWRSGHIKRVQVGAVNERPFVVNASLGLYPDILRAREADSAAWGRNRAVALWSAARTALRSQHALRLTLQQGQRRERVRVSLLFIGNNRLQIENLGLPVGEGLGEQRLAAVCVVPMAWTAMLRLLALGASGQMRHADEVSSELVEALTVTHTHRLTRHRLQVTCDGEVAWMQTPLRVRVLPERLSLLCPRPE